MSELIKTTLSAYFDIGKKQFGETGGWYRLSFTKRFKIPPIVLAIGHSRSSKFEYPVLNIQPMKLPSISLPQLEKPDVSIPILGDVPPIEVESVLLGDFESPSITMPNITNLVPITIDSIPLVDPIKIQELGYLEPFTMSPLPILQSNPVAYQPLDHLTPLTASTINRISDPLPWTGITIDLPPKLDAKLEPITVGNIPSLDETRNLDFNMTDIPPLSISFGKLIHDSLIMAGGGFSKVASNIIGKIGGLMTQITSKWIIDEVVKTIAVAFLNIGPYIDPVFNVTVSDQINNKITRINNKIEAIKDKAMFYINDIYYCIVIKINETIKGINDIKNNVVSFINTTVITKINETITKLGFLYDEVKLKVASLNSQITTFVNEVKTNIVAKTNDAIIVINTGMANTATFINKLSDDIIDRINGSASVIIERFNVIILDIIQRTNNALVQIPQKVNIISSDITNRINDVLRDLPVKINDMSTAITDKINEKLALIPSKINESSAAISTAINTTLDNIPTMFNTISAQMLDQMNQKYVFIQERMNVVIIHQSEALVSAVNKIIKAINESTASIDTKIDSMYDIMNKMIISLNDTLNSTLITISSATSKKITESVQSALHVLYKGIGLTQGMMMSPIQLRNITTDGFEVFVLPNLYLNWVAIANI